MFKKIQFPILILLILVETIIWQWLPPVTLQRDFEILQAKKDLARQQLSADLLILGDSSAGLGISPVQLDRQTGFKTVNLALLAPCSSTAHILLLKEYLRNNPKPKAVLLMHSFDIWWRDIWMNEPWPPGTPPAYQMDVLTRLFGFGFWREILSYQWRHPEAVVPYRRLFHELLPSQKYAEDVQASLNVRGEFWLKKNERLEKWVILRQQLLENQGDYRPYLFSTDSETARAHNEASLIRDAKTDLVWMSTHPFKVSTFNLDALHQFLTFTGKEGIEVWIAFPPLWSVLQSKPETVNFLKAHNMFLHSLAEKYPHTQLLTEDFYWAKTGELLNSVEHLTIEGQRKLTDQLALKINSLMRK